MARTQEERRTETRALLLDAASDLFAHKGFHATSAEAVAAAAGRTTGALYDHFGGKEGLLVALVQRWVERVVLDLTAVFEGAPRLDQRLGSLWEGIIRGEPADGIDGGDEWLLLEFELWLHAVRDPQLGEVGAERFRTMRAGLAQGLDEWAREFAFVLPAPTAEVATQMIGLLLGAAFQHRLDPASVPSRTVVAGMLRIIGVPPVPNGSNRGR